MATDPLDPHPDVDNDALGISQSKRRSTWGLPSDEGAVGQQEAALPETFDYSGGLLVGHGVEETAQPVLPIGQLIRARIDAPHSYELPHEALHRRYEPARIVPIAQSAIGTLMFAVPQIGLHFVKLIALNLSLAAAGTLQFVQGDSAGTNVAPVGSTQGTAVAGGAGAQNLAAATPLILPPAELQNPWLWTAPDLALGLITTGAGAFANGWAVIAFSPYGD